jgi:fido (protein-threonine AMPylation protein)
MALGRPIPTTERNLRIACHRIELELRQAIDDAQYSIDHQSYPADELAVRFHHRLVAVHPFPGGNGRWSRLAGDLLVIERHVFHVASGLWLH